ncbi:MAG: hypothetical protein ABH831_03065 [Candidatus Nealsonbacteria bacterium]
MGKKIFGNKRKISKFESWKETKEVLKIFPALKNDTKKAEKEYVHRHSKSGKIIS